MHPQSRAHARIPVGAPAPGSPRSASSCLRAGPRLVQARTRTPRRTCSPTTSASTVERPPRKRRPSIACRTRSTHHRSPRDSPFRTSIPTSRPNRLHVREVLHGFRPRARHLRLTRQPPLGSHAAGERETAHAHRRPPSRSCWTSCARTSTSSVPRRAVTTASAAPARSWSTAVAPTAACCSPSPSAAATSRPSRGSQGTVRNSIRFSALSWTATPFSAATAPRDRSAAPSAAIAEAESGHPSHVTDPAVPSGQPVPLGGDEIRERLSGNLCRCGAYPHIVEAVQDVIS